MPTIPVVFKSAPLPFNWNGTVQELADAIVARLYLESSDSFILPSSGTVLPTSDVGPFLLNGTTWYVWDVGTGVYVPVSIPQLTEFNPKPFRGNASAAQTIVLGAGPASGFVDLTFVQDFDPDNVFAPSVFSVPEDGIYHIDCKVGVSASVAPTGAVVTLFLRKNGAQMATETTFGYPAADPTGRIYLISTNIALLAGDLITATLSASTSGGAAVTWTTTLNDTYLSGFKIKST